jgi:hypothetical protein
MPSDMLHTLINNTHNMSKTSITWTQNVSRHHNKVKTKQSKGQTGAKKSKQYFLYSLHSISLADLTSSLHSISLADLTSSVYYCWLRVVLINPV